MTSTTKRKKNGDIFEISLLPWANLYAYGKYIKVENYVEKWVSPDLLRVYDIIVDTPLGGDIVNEELNLLFNPMYLMGSNILTKEHKIVANIPITEDDLIFPHMRRPETESLFGGRILGWNAKSTMELGKNLNQELLSFDEVKHLDSGYLVMNVSRIYFRVYLEYARINNIPIDENRLDPYEKYIFDEVIPMPLLRDIPIEDRFYYKQK